MDELILQVNHLSKSFGSNLVLKDIDFSVSTGDVIRIISTFWKRRLPAKSSTTERTC